MFAVQLAEANVTVSRRRPTTLYPIVMSLNDILYLRPLFNWLYKNLSKNGQIIIF